MTNENAAAWKIEYQNDTGPHDESFAEWWEVTNGTTTYKCESEQEAIWLADLLHGLSPPNAGIQPPAARVAG